MTALSQAAYARHAGVDRSQVTRWKAGGKLVMAERGLVDVEASDVLRAGSVSPYPHHAARTKPVTETPADADAALAEVAEGSGWPANEALDVKLKRARVRREEADAAKAEMDRDERAGKLVWRADVEFVFAEAGRAFEALRQQAIDALVPQLMTCNRDADEYRRAVSDALHDMQAEYAATVERQMTKRLEAG